MDRRQFIANSMATFFTMIIAGRAGASVFLPKDLEGWSMGKVAKGTDPAPKPEVTAAVDVIVPPDPEIPNDFKGSDYGGDWAVAASLGDLGQIAVVFYLNQYARKVASKSFLQCDEQERIEAIRQWIRERDEIQPLIKDLLTGLTSIAMIGTFEENEPAAEKRLFESMNWYDPNDPTGTFRIPCEGYPDSFIFPVTLKKGVKEELGK